MTEINTLLLMVLIEIALVTSSVLLVIVIRSVLKKRAERAAIQDLITGIKENEEVRIAATCGILEQKFGIEDGRREEIANDISREEKRFYQTLINLYLQRDSTALRNLHDAVETLVGPYRRLEIPQSEVVLAPAPAEEAVPDAEDQSQELDRLQKENERLNMELGETMDTMGRMLNEYASMYSGGSADDMDKEKILESFRAESARARAEGDKPQPDTQESGDQTGVDDTPLPAKDLLDDFVALEDDFSDDSDDSLQSGMQQSELNEQSPRLPDVDVAGDEGPQRPDISGVAVAEDLVAGEFDELDAVFDQEGEFPESLPSDHEDSKRAANR